MTLPERKLARYAKLAWLSDPWAEIDAHWADTADPRFDKAREIDDWLVEHREDETSETEYYAKCVELYRLYTEGK